MLLPNVASAEILIGNLQNDNGTHTQFGTGSTTQFKAAGWIMGADSFHLGSIQVDLDFQGDTGQGVWEIWSGAGAPLTSEISLNFNGPQTGIGVFTLTAANPFVMNAGETYWLHASASDTTPRWDWNASNDAPTGIVASACYNFNGNPSSFQNMYQVNAVPEPTSAAIIGLACAGLAVRRRKR